MDCDFSIPVDYSGSPPTNNITPFAFSHLHCVASTSAPASPSAYVDIASGSAIANGLAGTFDLLFIFCLFVIFYMFFQIGKGMLKK